MRNVEVAKGRPERLEDVGLIVSEVAGVYQASISREVLDDAFSGLALVELIGAKLGDSFQCSGVILLNQDFADLIDTAVLLEKDASAFLGLGEEGPAIIEFEKVPPPDATAATPLNPAINPTTVIHARRRPSRRRSSKTVTRGVDAAMRAATDAPTLSTAKSVPTDAVPVNRRPTRAASQARPRGARAPTTLLRPSTERPAAMATNAWTVKGPAESSPTRSMTKFAPRTTARPAISNAVTVEPHNQDTLPLSSDTQGFLTSLAALGITSRAKRVSIPVPGASPNHNTNSSTPASTYARMRSVSSSAVPMR